MKKLSKQEPEGCTFTPALSKLSRKKADLLDTTVQERLEKSLDLGKLQDKFNQTFDPKTGQELFTPKINRTILWK